jgi:hypothetical protein
LVMSVIISHRCCIFAKKRLDQGQPPDGTNLCAIFEKSRRQRYARAIICINVQATTLSPIASP